MNPFYKQYDLGCKAGRVITAGDLVRVDMSDRDDEHNLHGKFAVARNVICEMIEVAPGQPVTKQYYVVVNYFGFDGDFPLPVEVVEFIQGRAL